MSRVHCVVKVSLGIDQSEEGDDLMAPRAMAS
jgi:hypothetical protein